MHMTWLRNPLLAAAIVGSLLSIAPAPVQADDYWNGYWGWYDNTYTPGYGRYYSSRPVYGGAYYSQPYYGGAYYSQPYYSQPYYGNYYGVPGAGVQVYGVGRAVNVGPVRFGWR
jgi:hypothetical protein